MVELDGTEKYDVFYAWDTDSVWKTISDGIANRTIKPNPVVRGDRSMQERVQSRDVQDRVAVEKAYQQGDHDLRQSLLEAAARHGEAAPVDLLRQAVFGFDADLGKQARTALARSDAVDAVPLIGDALKVPLPASERDALIAALQKLGDKSPQARTLAVVHQGMAQQHSAVDVAGWTRALAGAGSYQPASDPLVLDARVDHKNQVAKAKPDDATAQIELAEALLTLATEPQTGRALAADPRTAQAFERLRFLDAEQAGRKAEQLGATSWRANAVLALCAWNLGNRDEAWRRAETAVAGLPDDNSGYNAMAVLQLFAEARQHAIAQAWRQKQQWPSQWLTDVHAAYSVLLKHPFGTDQHVANHYDFLQFFGVGQAARVLDEGLQRFPDSPLLHQRLRSRILAEKGVDGLQSVYAEMLGLPGAAPNLEWFAGYAGLVAAEFQRHAGKPDQALSAYDQAIAHYEHYVEQHPDLRASADHYAAMALGAKARIRLEQGDLDGALALVQQALARRPEAAAALDGLNLSTVDTAKMLRQSLVAQQRQDLLAQLDAALGKLDPSQLELPAYERETPPAGGEGGQRRGRRGRGR
jgi:tetratricopeptide (TPR) repeat protein